MSKTDNAYNVICPVCDAWKKKSCVHTKGSKKGKKRSEPHPDRVRLAKVKLSSEDKEKIERVSKEYKIPEKSKKAKAKEVLTEEQKRIVDTISDKISALNRDAEFIGPVSVGPLISTYRFFPLRHTKVAHLEAMSKDFAVSLGTDENILVKRMPGESAVGVFVPNKKRGLVEFRNTLPAVKEFMAKKTEDGHLPIPLNFGITVNGDPFVDDLTVQPHLLMAGTTGGGKSTLLHSFFQTILYTMTPDQIKVGICDTKANEFKPFFKDLMMYMFREIATDEYSSIGLLDYAKEETQARLDKFAWKGVRNIHQWNEAHKNEPEKKIPYWVIFIDELFDLLGRPEKSIAKANSKRLEEIAGRSRASGIHLIVSTQRPAISLIKGQIKANFPSRVTFRLPSHQDSRTVLNTKGAESLMSRGDMLYSSSVSPELKRLHAPYTSLEETKAIVEHILLRERDRTEKLEKEALERALEVKESFRPAAKVQ